VGREDAAERLLSTYDVPLSRLGFVGGEEVAISLSRQDLHLSVPLPTLKDAFDRPLREALA
jgi:phosphoribosylformylglycinamidine synthase